MSTATDEQVDVASLEHLDFTIVCEDDHDVTGEHGTPCDQPAKWSVCSDCCANGRDPILVCDGHLKFLLSWFRHYGCVTCDCCGRTLRRLDMHIGPLP